MLRASDNLGERIVRLSPDTATGTLPTSRKERESYPIFSTRADRWYHFLKVATPSYTPDASEFPFNGYKNGPTQDADDAAIVNAVMLAHSMKLNVIAEASRLGARLLFQQAVGAAGDRGDAAQAGLRIGHHEHRQVLSKLTSPSLRHRLHPQEIRQPAQRFLLAASRLPAHEVGALRRQGLVERA